PMFRPIIAAIVFFGSPAVSVAQSGGVIDLRSANELKVRTEGGEEVRELIGNVHFIQTTPAGERVYVWCDRALRYMARNRIDLFGNVRMMRDSVTLSGPEATWFSDVRRARMLNGVMLRKGPTTLSARTGDYFSDNKIAYFRGEVIVFDEASTTFADMLTFYEDEDRSVAVGNVRVISDNKTMTIYGDSLINEERRNYTLVPLNPRLVQIDTTTAGDVDTLVVVSRQMEAFQDTSNRFVATDSVLLARTDMSARCREATLERDRNRIILRGQPVVWHEENQVSGDSIVVTLRDNRLESVYVRGRAMAISRTDSTYRDRFDQLTGRELTLFFEEGKISRIEVETMATSLYYLFDGEVPNGVNRSSGDRIVMLFAD
ncbi:MAG: OstA-like protein, partial [Bacteroidota bacterium]